MPQKLYAYVAEVEEPGRGWIKGTASSMRYLRWCLNYIFDTERVKRAVVEDWSNWTWFVHRQLRNAPPSWYVTTKYGNDPRYEDLVDEIDWGSHMLEKTLWLCEWRDR